MKKLLTIIIPVYNSIKTIECTMNTLKNQNCQNFEVVIVDDGSTDGSLEKIRELNKDVEKFSITVISQENRGPSSARNVGIENSNGKYIMFLDSDDIYSPNMTKIMVDNMENSKSDLVVCGIKKKMKRKEYMLNMESTKYFDQKSIANNLENIQKKEILNSVSNKIYLLSIVREMKITFDENLSMGEDFRFNLQYINIINKMNIISDVLYIYETNSSYLTNKIRKNDYDNRKGNIEILDKFYKKHNLEVDLSFQYVKIFYSEIFNSFKEFGVFNFKKNINVINKLLIKEEIKTMYEKKITGNKIEKILTYPISHSSIVMIYSISILSFCGRNLKFNKIKTRSM
ncbi:MULTISPECIES: glycosyltransferase family A protein [Vagococcus]|uniref:Glycosyl transferase n=1 Tax=Vagococcus fluvialis bH819 TaxID=1255619 RepID=A0A1X6WLP1_9ENTE|nr:MULTISPECIES: glycosyltransferase family A protein [Vagococcus]SLM85244.1 glycosyl transferase [Vagococcus fluvialis bH819]HCM89456.1 glycosyltransferase family 2 protein [Vagococcus sp.]